MERQNSAKSKKTKKKSGKHKISYQVKPEKMSLEEWQIALRKQVALQEKFVISCVDDELRPGEYCVRNPKSEQEYKVVYRGAKSEWNYCSCMDFKTSQLGTCKHLEAVKHWLGGSSKRRVRVETPSYTSVYLSYRAERRVCIRIGTDNADAFRSLVPEYFHADGVLLDKSYRHFGDFLKAALSIDDTFRCYKDALDFVIDKRESLQREEFINRCGNTDIDNLLKTKLYDYQKEGIRFAAKAGRSVIADEMGLGKTIQAIGTAELLRKEGLVDSILILCPTSLKYQWKREIEKFTDAKATVVEGNHLKRKYMYSSQDAYKIVSYNSACNDIKILGSLTTDMIIMDEVQRLKNWNTQISIAARRIDSRYSVILSGTPFENKLEELYSVMEFVDQFCLGPYYKFKDKYIITDENGKMLGYKNLNSIGEKLSDILIRRRKKDVALQLPERIDKNLFIPVTKQQMGMHNELKYTVGRIIQKWNKAHFLSEKDRRRLLLCLSQMRMLCDSTYILDQKTRFDTKIEETMNILDGIFNGSDDKVVIFSQWERMTRLVAKELEKKGIRYDNLNGSMSASSRKDSVNDFTDNPESRVFLSTDAGCTGLNLQVASVIINLDLPWNPAVLEQRIARIYRIGQKRNIEVINLVAPNTIEEQMLGKLKFKSSMFEGVLDKGDDSVMMDDNKFSILMDTIGDVITVDNDDLETVEQVVETTDTEAPLEKNEKEEPQNPISETSQEENYDDIPRASDSQPASDALSLPEQNTTQSKITSDDDSRQKLVADGISFLSRLSETLKSSEETEKFVSNLVVEDKETGEMSLRIPVPNKQVVKQLLDVVSKLFGA